GRLDLVEEVERARLGEKEREQERDRAERLLAARQKREPCDLLAGGAELHLDAGVAAVPVGNETEPPAPARERRSGDVLEVGRNGGKRLVESAPHRLGELVAQLRHFPEALFEVGALIRELVESLLLRLVLLLRERIHLAERLAARLEPLGPAC